MHWIGITGTRNPPKDFEMKYKPVITWFCNQLKDDEITFVVGACVGVDALVARMAMSLGHKVHAVVPDDLGLVDKDWDVYCTSYELMPKGTSYRDRNERIVELLKEHDGLLMGFPKNDTVRGSGTWMTINIAKKQNVPVVTYKVTDPIVIETLSTW